MAFDKLDVSELAATRVVALPPLARVGHVAAVLASCGHASFPVTPDVEKALDSGGSFELHGVVRRSTLVALLSRRAGLFAARPGDAPPPESASIPTTQAARLALLDGLASRPIKIPRPAEAATLASLTDAERSLWLDIRPFMRRAPFVLPATASVARAHRLLSSAGAACVLVGAARPRVRGVLTRKDVTEENAEACLGAKAAAGREGAAGRDRGGGDGWAGGRAPV